LKYVNKKIVLFVRKSPKTGQNNFYTNLFLAPLDRKCCIYANNISLISFLVAKAQINGSTEGSVYIHYNFIDFEYRYGLCQVWKNK